jgi:lysophospholipase L1-like esterase
MVAAWLRWCVVVAVLCLGLADEVSAKTVFLGGSQTAGWKYMGCFKDVVNKAAVSNTTSKILKTLDPVVRMKPEKVFILEGINELYSSNESILARYREILRRINQGSPKTMIFVQSVLPVCNRSDLSNTKITELNAGLKALCGECANCVYVDLFSHFVEDGQLRQQLTTDGVHLRPDGYKLWQSLIEPYLTTPNAQLTRPEVVARLGQPGGAVVQ